MAEPRPISEIAQDIYLAWKPVNYAAKPYLEAMLSINKITDMYMNDTARSVVTYFLGNARSFQGPTAKKLKDELKALMKAPK